ncbi:hypothetical protein LSTR_LSTR000635 [Laodelphax striatellus]|uniref:Uncharacterized protein n=1 Tax=Laodelphax striatellus TaxID=195883 RepID=A0A482XFX6_LAOST|nr:hypothetical protein LSTR_LSTR000635 [Laodelphax striatellus]
MAEEAADELPSTVELTLLASNLAAAPRSFGFGEALSFFRRNWGWELPAHLQILGIHGEPKPEPQLQADGLKSPVRFVGILSLKNLQNAPAVGDQSVDNGEIAHTSLVWSSAPREDQESEDELGVPSPNSSERNMSVSRKLKRPDTSIVTRRLSFSEMGHTSPPTVTAMNCGQKGKAVPASRGAYRMGTRSSPRRGAAAR